MKNTHLVQMVTLVLMDFNVIKRETHQRDAPRDVLRDAQDNVVRIVGQRCAGRRG